MRKNAGFSLIEAAIVLGIVGLVIGGIWVAASTVQDRMRINGAIELLNALHEKASAFKRTTTSGYDLLPLMKTFPGGYTIHPDSGYLNSGSQFWLASTAVFEGTPYLNITIVFNSDYSGNHPKPTLCLELSKKLLAMVKGPRPSCPSCDPSDPYPNIEWNDGFGTAQAWDGGMSIPNTSTLVTRCRDAAQLNIYSAL